MSKFTTVWIKRTDRERIQKLKDHPRQPVSEIITKLLDDLENEANKNDP